MKVKVYCINEGTSAAYYGLCNAQNGVPLYAPNNWKTERGAIRWAQGHGHEVQGASEVEKRIEDVTKKFLIVRDALAPIETLRAFRLCYKKPWKFYRDHTPEEAIEIIKREAEGCEDGQD